MFRCPSPRLRTPGGQYVAHAWGTQLANCLEYVGVVPKNRRTPHFCPYIFCRRLSNLDILDQHVRTQMTKRELQIGEQSRSLEEGQGLQGLGVGRWKDYMPGQFGQITAKMNKSWLLADPVGSHARHAYSEGGATCRTARRVRFRPELCPLDWEHFRGLKKFLWHQRY